jgi:TonB family protein
MSLPEVYTPDEIARAAGVSTDRAVAALGSPHVYVSHESAVGLARALRGAGVTNLAYGPHAPGSAMFSIFASATCPPRSKGLPLAVSSTLHAGVLGATIVITTMGLTSSATTLPSEQPAPEPSRLVFLMTPGPGGGGGGGGARQKPPAPKAMRQGTRRLSSPLPERRPPEAIAPEVDPPEAPPPPLNAEPLPVVVAPIVRAPSDSRDRIGILSESRTDAESRGPGQGGGAGPGRGTGLGEGDGSGVGPGSGGGIGGGPFRPGAGIEPPRLLREVKGDYTEEARRRGLEGEVLLEVVVRRDGSVGDVTLVRRIGSGLDERAVQAVRQWRFAPARRFGTPVDVIVEIAVAFRLR